MADNWEQVKKFDIKKMGTTIGLCLKNVRLGFGIPSKYPDAKAAMEANKKAGTLHPISTIPKNCSVPVFTDTSSVYEHIEAYDKGVYYSDGRKVTNPKAQKYFGWGETLNGVRVVKKVKTTEPKKTESKKTGIKVGDTVIVNGAGTGNSQGGGGKTRSFKNQKMKVIIIQNGRYGCNQYNKKGAGTGFWTAKQVKKA